MACEVMMMSISGLLSNLAVSGCIVCRFLEQLSLGYTELLLPYYTYPIEAVINYRRLLLTIFHPFYFKTVSPFSVDVVVTIFPIQLLVLSPSRVTR